MAPRILRLVYAIEFLVALVAIFTSWSEIGGQAALDLMYWAWKLGLGFALAASIVAFTAAAVAEESAWTLRSLRWLAVIIILVCGIGVVTYFYVLQEQPNEQEENGNGNVSVLLYSAVHSQNYV